MTAADAAAPLLQGRDISLGYARADGSTQWVLEGFSIDVQPGELIALLGPSGVGKSSLLRVLPFTASVCCGLCRTVDCMWLFHRKQFISHVELVACDTTHLMC